MAVLEVKLIPFENRGAEQAVPMDTKKFHTPLAACTTKSTGLSARNLYGQVEDGRQSLEDLEIISETALTQQEIITLLHPCRS